MIHMKVWRKFTAIALAFVMVVALSATAFAASNGVALSDKASDTTYSDSAENTVGQAGTFYESGKAPQGTDAYKAWSTDKTVILKKEITAYNPYVGTEDKQYRTIFAPTISYQYNIEAVVTGGDTITATNPAYKNVTDSASKHEEDSSVTRAVYTGAGVDNIEINGTTITGGAKGVLSWNSSQTLNANSVGYANYGDIKVDFTGVDFQKPGIFRYKISESMPTTDSVSDNTELVIASNTYAGTGVTETNGTHIRYIDVYVKTADNYTVSGGASNWVIYGFTCFYNDSNSITNDNKSAGTDSPVKTFGFVKGTSDGTTVITADSYYTFDLSVSKTVVNDSFAASTHAFPFTISLTNDSVKQPVKIITELAKKDSGKDAAPSAVLVSGISDNNKIYDSATSTTNSGAISGKFDNNSSNDFQGVLALKHNTEVKFVGIPCGTSAAVYETNDMTGVTYHVKTVVDDADAQDAQDGDDQDNDSVVSTTTPNSIALQTGDAAIGQSTKGTITTNNGFSSEVKAHNVDIINTLIEISPTGVTMRYAPYLAMLGAGVVALPLTFRKKKEELF